MKERDFAEFARGVPVVTTRQVAAMLGDKTYARLYLHRMSRRGIIRRVARGCYTAHEDPVIYASHIRYPSYISLWYAFQHHGATTQLPRTIEVMAATPGRGEGVEFVRTRQMWGYAPVGYAGFRIMVADLEKAVLDAAQTGRIPMDDIADAIPKCEEGKLEAYAMRYGAATAKKVGYAAEVAGMHLGKLHERAKSDRNYVHIGVKSRKTGWKVVE